jgi:hypothetical protein
MENLLEKFRKVGLDAIIEKNPIRKGRGMEDIFQLDIQRNMRGNSRWERFRIYPGHADNIAQIRDTDKSSKQVLLLVQEPVREFDNVVSIGNRFNTFKQIKEEAEKRRGFLRIFKQGKEAHVVMRAPGGKRYFLLGVDERQLFIAQLRGPATSVEGAREQLGRTVQFADGTRKGSSIDRQGEWFFLETRDSTREQIAIALQATRTAIRRKVNIGGFLGRPGVNPHIADELVTLPHSVTDTNSARMAGGNSNRLQRDRVFVRGSIRHKDHKTVRFSQWREVIANNEGDTARATASGVFWVD